MIETATVTMASSFDRPLPVSKFDKFESGKSVWDAHRSIWQDNSAEAETSRPTTVRHNSTSSNKFGRTINGSALSTIENSRNVSTDLNTWGSSNGGAVNSRQNSTLTSPTKRKQSGWLFDSTTHDVENSSNLLAGSAPEFEPFGDTIPQEKLVTSRPVRLSDESLSYDGRFAPALRSTGPQLPAPNRLPPHAAQTNGISHGIQNNTRSSNGMVSMHDYRGRTDALPMDMSPPTSRGLASGSVRSNSNTISPTTARFARQMNGYLDRTASTMEDTLDGFRALSINKGSSGYDKFGHFYDSQRPVINGDDDFGLLGSTFEGGNYYRTSPYFGQEYLEQQCIPAWAYWSANDGKLRSDYAPEYRNGGNSPYHSSSLTPSSGTESIRSAVASRNSQHDMVMANRKPGTQDSYYQSAYQGNLPLDMAVRGPMNPLAPPYYMTNYVTGPRQYLAREEQRGAIHRSPLLEEFRINKSTKRYDLRDIFGHIVEFSGDQHGSRFIQQKLETANSDEKDQVFKEIQSEAMQLMTDVFGNYVIQKMFEHGSQSQKKVLAEYMKGRVAYLSTQMYGCRVVQKALEHVLTDQQASMVKELDGPNKAILKIIKDQNGNHVVQKAIERVPAEYIQFIIDAHKGEAVKLAQHTYGCRVIQRMLEHCTPAAKRIILDELHGCVGPLITDQFGNYVVQHIIQNGELADRRRVVSIVMQQLMHFSKHKFASNVVEKCLEFADEDQQRMMFLNLIQPDASGQSPVYGLLRDQYGNYVIQKVFNMLEGQQRVILEGEMRACFLQLKRTSYGKQVTAIEKLLYGNGHPMPASSMAPNGPLIAAPGRAAKH